jgi:hypothetical protein
LRFEIAADPRSEIAFHNKKNSHLQAQHLRLKAPPLGEESADCRCRLDF